MSQSSSAKALYQDLIEHGHIFPVGVPGIFGRGPIFEDILERFESLISRVASEDGAIRMNFPPCINRHVLQKSQYLELFPQLVGTIYSYKGESSVEYAQANQLEKSQIWDEMQTITDCCLTPAACYPVYPVFSGHLPKDGRTIEMQSWVFRHEPSPEPTRMMAYRIREFVRLGNADIVIKWRDLWLGRGMQILKSLELPVSIEVASDPFFGRGGRFMASTQKEQKLKFEIVAPVISDENPTALCSFNYHQDKFGALFGIKTSVNETAETACLGFGLERIVMALLKTHGMHPQDWPRSVRNILWP